MLYVKDICAACVVTIEKNQSLWLAARLMDVRGIGALAVMDDGEMVGIITEADLTREFPSFNRQKKKVAEAMTEGPAFVGPDASVSEAARLMSRYHTRHLPVVDSGKPVGMISARDLLSVLRTGTVTQAGAC